MGFLNTASGRTVFTNNGNSAATVTQWLDSNNCTGLGGVAPKGAAWLKIAAGTATKAPLLMVSGANLTTAKAGAMEYDGTNLWFTPVGTQRYTIPFTAFTATADGLDSNVNTETSILGTGVGSKTIPANSVAAGRTIKIKVCGYKNAGSAQAITIKVKLGSTVICTTGSITPTVATNSYFEVVALLTFRTTGSSGLVMGNAKFLETGTTTQTSSMDNISAIAVNTTGTLAIDVTAQWGSAATTNVINGKNVTIEFVN
jgi:hypothetical protein